MPDKVPLWIIKNTFCPYGSRMPGRPETLGPELKICKTCGKEMYNFRDWNWCAGEYYCNGKCIEDARAEDRAKWQARIATGRVTPITESRAWREDSDDDRIGFEYMEFGARAVPRTEAEIPAGNLKENDYAFWIGTLHKYSNGVPSLRATCRACNQTVHGEDGRLAHKTKSTFYKDGLNCCKVLMLCYQQLLKQDVCMVCNNKCYGKQKWGVPLCCPNCIKIWKFQEDMEYDALERTAMQYWVALEETQKRTGGSTISASSSSQTQTFSQEEE